MENEEKSDLEVLNEEDTSTNKDNDEVVNTDNEDNEEETTDEETDKEVEEEEEEIEEDEEEEEELTSKYDRPTKAEIKAKYPEIFKDFPELQHALFREQKFNTLFDSVEEAEEVKESAAKLEELGSLLTSGKASEFFKTIEETNAGTLKNLAPNLLSTIYEIDKAAYDTTITPLLESVVRTAYKDGVNSNNENLKNAALIISKAIFGDSGFEIAKGQKTSIVTKQPNPQLDEERKQLDRERSEIQLTKYNEFRGTVIKSCDRQLQKAILSNFDPENVFNESLREILIEKVYAETEKQLSRNKKHMEFMNSMWSKASRAGFTGDWKDRIISSYLSRAKSIMPAIRQQVRAKALNQKVDESNNLLKRGKLDANRKELKQSVNLSNGGNSNKTLNPTKINYSKTSDLDILNDKVTIKKA